MQMLVHDSHNRIYGDAILQWDHLYRPAFSRLHDDHLPITAHTVRAVGYPLLQLRDHLILMRLRSVPRNTDRNDAFMLSVATISSMMYPSLRMLPSILRA